jgi:N-acetylglucosaminyldiphosphoundecaprenol N-acetyl-beta-D-mannosaminyltransferase
MSLINNKIRIGSGGGNTRGGASVGRAGGSGASVRIGRVAFDDVTMEEAVARILLCVQKSDKAEYVCTGNLDHLAMLQKDADFRAIYEKAALVLADGMPIIWLSKLAARRNRSITPLRERVAGSDLFWELGRVSAQNGLRLFLLGGMPGAAERAANALRERYPGAVVCGHYCPPFETFHTPAEQTRIEAKIREASPDVLLVGLGAPKQEKWIAAHKDMVDVPVSIGVGGSFEMAAGMVKRAPAWAQRSGMEWACRMMQDPRRLVRRYLGRDLPFLFHLLVNTIIGGSVADTARPRSGAAVDLNTVSAGEEESAAPLLASATSLGGMPGLPSMPPAGALAAVETTPPMTSSAATTAVGAAAR